MSGWVSPPPRSELKWLAVDFDDTLARSGWSPDNPSAAPGEPIESNVTELKRCHGMGWKIAIHTSRPWADYEVVESWLEWHKVPFNRIVCGKLLAFAYLDDRNRQLGQPWV